VPMLLAGDEMGRSQQGNNNTYCQDNELSWVNWQIVDEELLDFTRRLIQFRKDHPVFRQRGWFQGMSIRGSAVHDIGWFTPAGEQMSDEDWSAGFAKSLGVFLNGMALRFPNEKGERIKDDTFYVIFNGHHEALPFTLPPVDWSAAWEKVLDTSSGLLVDKAKPFKPTKPITIEGRSIVVLRHAN